MSGEQQTQEKMVPMSAIEQACRDVFLDKTRSTVANELQGNMPGIAYYAIWRRCHESAIPAVTTGQVEAAMRAAWADWTSQKELQLASAEANIRALTGYVQAHLFPKKAPADTNPS